METGRCLYVRGDGNLKIGAGHLMRLMTITDRIRDQIRIIYICADSESAALPMSKGYETRVLNSDYRQMEEEPELIEKLLETPKDGTVILVDSYYVTNSYLEKLGEFGRVVLLDDMGENIFPVDGIINYNAFASLTRYQKNYPEVLKMIGPSYVPLRPQFLRERQTKAGEREILITTGGGDQDNIAGQILEKIYSEEDRYHVICGQFSKNYPFLQEFALQHNNVKIHQKVEDMAALMNRCEIGITAGGTTIYEMCAAGLPFICFSYADNQRALVDFVLYNQVGESAGHYQDDSGEVLSKIKVQKERLLSDLERRKKMMEQARKLVDGRGADRLAEGILSLF